MTTMMMIVMIPLRCDTRVHFFTVCFDQLFGTVHSFGTEDTNGTRKLHQSSFFWSDNSMDRSQLVNVNGLFGGILINNYARYR